MSMEVVKTQLPIATMADLHKIGEAIAASRMFGIDNAASGLIVAATCHQQGITLLDFCRTYWVVLGRPTMKYDAMLAEFRKKGGRYSIIETSVTRAAAVFEFEGQKHDWEYTLEDAKRTGDALDGKGRVKDMWLKRPEDMLWARLVSRSVRKLAPEICAGLYTPEEVADIHKTEPVALTQDEIIARAKIVEPIAEPITEMPENYDCNVCPAGYGKWSGKPWDDMPAHILHSALDSKRLDIDTESAIIRVLEARGEA
jgi:hypothetical protein